MAGRGRLTQAMADAKVVLILHPEEGCTRHTAIAHNAAVGCYDDVGFCPAVYAHRLVEGREPVVTARLLIEVILTL